MKNVVIAGSVGLPDALQRWVAYWNAQEGCRVTNYPVAIAPERLREEYPNVYKDYFLSLQEADILFVANQDKRGIRGYIGAEVFAEIAFVLALNVIEGKKTEILLAQMPSEQIQAHAEMRLWMDLGYIHILQ